ncbi:phospholipase D-like domain-containing protein [Streptomyces sp. NBC_00258]|uniref:phospholipase D-like domain-containing protein n=1 Tax=Streptomyces sp. NBC_00258 TaxID=2903642 RepID=UPI002E286CB4|nr:phospholipase D-like domain-containing protein [Streptomyces sp. NBC_00258]
MGRQIRWTAALTVPLALGATLLAPTTAAQAETVVSGNYTSVFNYPRPTSAYDFSISTGAGELIDLAAPDSTLYMGMYWFSSATLREKLAAAQTRGVTLRIVAEGANSGDLSQLPLTGDSTLTRCSNGCLGNGSGDTRAINHDKYMVLDALTDGRKNVVWQSSQNLAGGQDGEINNAVVVAGNATLATRYRNHFNDQVEHAGDSLHTTYDHTTGDPNSPVEAYFSPRDTASDATHYGNADILASFIDQVDCRQDGKIRIAAAELDQRSTRPAVYEALETKRTEGCAIEANVRDLSDGGGNNGVDELAGLDIPAYGNRPGGCRYKATATSSCNRGTVHSKYLLTEWKKDDGTQVQHVYTGSHNWTAGSLKTNDETILRIDDAGTYQAFVANFNKARALVTDIDATKYGSTSQHYSRVNVKANGDQHYSAVASGGTSAVYTAVVYEQGDRHDASDTELGTDVYIRMYKDGVPLWDEQLLSNSGTGTTWSHQKPDVGVDDQGNAIVVWAKDDDGNKYADIAVRRITPAGTVTTLPRPHASGDGDQLRPTVAVAGDGSYGVAWESTADGSTLNQVYASSWSPTGAARYQDVQVSTIASGAAGSNRRPDAAIDDAGNMVVAWEEDADGNGGLNVGVAKLTASGGFAVARKVANSLTDGQQTRPAVASAGDGRFVVAWTDEYTTGTGTLVRDQRIQHRVFSATGTPAAADRRTTEEPTGTGPYVDAKRPISDQADADVAVADDGSFVVAWKEAFDVVVGNPATLHAGQDDVWARGFNADGTTADRLVPTRMNVVTGGGQGGPAVALAANGRLALTYSDDYDGNGHNEMRLRDAFKNA